MSSNISKKNPCENKNITKIVLSSVANSVKNCAALPGPRGALDFNK